MKLAKDTDGTPVIKEVFSGAYIETAEGNRIGFCMRDDTIEFNVLPADKEMSKWYRVNMQTLAIQEMDESITSIEESDNDWPETTIYT